MIIHWWSTLHGNLFNVPSVGMLNQPSISHWWIKICHFRQEGFLCSLGDFSFNFMGNLVKGSIRRSPLIGTPSAQRGSRSSAEGKCRVKNTPWCFQGWERMPGCANWKGLKDLGGSQTILNVGKVGLLHGACCSPDSNLPSAFNSMYVCAWQMQLDENHWGGVPASWL